MKKVLTTAALLCAVSSFATWDLFPVKPAGKGEAKVGFEYLTAGDGVTSIPFGARFSVIEGLELSAKSGYGITAEALNQPEVGIRYGLGIGATPFVDVIIPIEDGENLGFHFGSQYSTKASETLEIGSEVGVYLGLENGDTKVTPPMMLNVSAEADYSMGSLTPFLALNYTMGLTDGKVGDVGGAGATDGMPDLGDLGDFGDLLGGAMADASAAAAGAAGTSTDPDIDVTLGAIFAINDMLSVDASVTLLGLLNDADMGDKILVGANLSVNF